MSQPAILAHHFDTIEQQNEANTMGMWLFLVTEVMFFGGLFAGYAVYRYLYPDVYEAMALEMSVPLGTLNTGILLASSFTMVLGVHFAKEGKKGPLIFSLMTTILCALGFLVVKAFEYKAKYEHGLMIGPYFSWEGPQPEKMHLVMCLYFFMTGLHAFHILIGIAIIGYLVWMAIRNKFSSERFMPVELTGLYWHFVDLIWVFLFPLFYLVGTR